MIFFILYCSNIKDIINDSVEDCSPLAFIDFEYLYAASNISLNNSRFDFLKNRSKAIPFVYFSC